MIRKRTMEVKTRALDLKEREPRVTFQHQNVCISSPYCTCLYCVQDDTKLK